MQFGDKLLAARMLRITLGISAPELPLRLRENDRGFFSRTMSPLNQRHDSSRLLPISREAIAGRLFSTTEPLPLIRCWKPNHVKP